MELFINDGESMWGTIDKLFHKFPDQYYALGYPIFSVALGVCTFYIFYLSSILVVNYNWSQYNQLNAFLTSITLTLQLIGIQYFTDKMKLTFRATGPLIKMEPTLFQLAKNKFSQSKTQVIVIMLVVFPFILIRLSDIILGYTVFFYQEMSTWAGLVFDIYNNFIWLLNLYLLAVVLWILILIWWSINYMVSKSDEVKLDYQIDNLGGLKPLKSLVLHYTIFYFLIITIDIISYVTPKGYLYYENLFLILLLLLGLVFFLVCWNMIRFILDKSIQNHENQINDLCWKKRKELLEVISKGEGSDKDKLDFISTCLESLHKEQEEITSDSVSVYNYKSLASFATSFLIPLVTYIEKLSTFKLTSWMMEIVRHLI